MNINILSKDGPCSFDCESAETLLYAGLRQGLALPYECATGTCGACRARLSAGEIELVWPEAPALSKIKREKGDVLLCQARPKTDCKLMIAANIAAQPSNMMPAHRNGKLQNLRRLTHDVIEFELVLSSPMSFKAGQFVVVEAKEVPGRRAYSMVNYESDTHTIALVVKRKPGGGFSDWLFEGDVEGAELDVFGPLGQATFNERDNKNLICIAGGSGIAGIMSILECATKKNYFRTHKGYVFFGVRTPADAFYQEQLAQFIDAGAGNLEVTIAFSHDANAANDPDSRGLKFAAGMVHEVAAQAMAGRYDDLIGYIAGPVPMVDGAIRMLIAEGGLSSQWIRYDKFS